MLIAGSVLKNFLEEASQSRYNGMQPHSPLPRCLPCKPAFTRASILETDPAASWQTSAMRSSYRDEKKQYVNTDNQTWFRDAPSMMTALHPHSFCRAVRAQTSPAQGRHGEDNTKALGLPGWFSVARAHCPSPKIRNSWVSSFSGTYRKMLPAHQHALHGRVVVKKQNNKKQPKQNRVA